MIRLYCHPETSEVTEEYPSLHAALADMRQPPPEASLVDNGITLALEYRDRWSLTSHGVRALKREYEDARGMRGATANTVAIDEAPKS